MKLKILTAAFIIHLKYFILHTHIIPENAFEVVGRHTYLGADRT